MKKTEIFVWHYQWEKIREGDLRRGLEGAVRFLWMV